MLRKLLLGLLFLAPLGFYPILRDKPDYDCVPPPPVKSPLDDEERILFLAFGSLPGPALPANIPWEQSRRVGLYQSQNLEGMAQKTPFEFLERCLSSYEDIQGYRCNFAKQERVKGKLHDPEVIHVHFRAKPFSVHMRWLEGADACFASMYVEGENNNMLQARSRLLGGFPGPIFTKALDSPEAKASSRFGMDKFGMEAGARDTVRAMRAAKERDKLFLKFEGIERTEKAGGRLCYKFVRTPYDPPESEGEQLNKLTIYIDRATLFQVGSILIDTKDELIAEYFFRDIELNPTFHEAQFTRKKL